MVIFLNKKEILDKDENSKKLDIFSKSELDLFTD